MELLFTEAQLKEDQQLIELLEQWERNLVCVWEEI